MERFAILLAGRIAATPQLQATIAGRRVIAADGGMAHAATLGVVPELWVGDFDSAPDDLPAPLAAVERHAVPRDKDETDGELAIGAALALGARDILLVGALGGARSDHAFSNLALVMRHAERGVRIKLFDGIECGVPLGPAPVRVDARPGQIFSVLLFGDVRGLTLRGARWPLTDASLPFGSILTQSNEATGPVEAVLRQGRALLLMQA